MTDNGEDLTPASRASDASGPAPAASGRRPQIRWGGVVWGVFLMAIGGVVLFTLSSRDRELGFVDWVAKLKPESAWTLAVVAVGVVILIMALLAAVRSAQRNRRA